MTPVIVESPLERARFTAHGAAADFLEAIRQSMHTSDAMAVYDAIKDLSQTWHALECAALTRADLLCGKEKR